MVASCDGEAARVAAYRHSMIRVASFARGWDTRARPVTVLGLNGAVGAGHLSLAPKRGCRDAFAETSSSRLPFSPHFRLAADRIECSPDMDTTSYREGGCVGGSIFAIGLQIGRLHSGSAEGYNGNASILGAAPIQIDAPVMGVLTASYNGPSRELLGLSAPQIGGGAEGPPPAPFAGYLDR